MSDRHGPPRPRRWGPPDGEPTVFAADEQTALAVDAEHLVGLAEVVLREEGVQGACELSLLFVEEAVMAVLNERWMGEDGPTDVLAFPIDQEGDPDAMPDPVLAGPDRPSGEGDDVPLLLGDVVVCPAVAERNARGAGGTVDDELALLVVHGVLHVLGMDHAEAEEDARMRARTEDLLERHHRARR